jgi:hypothetical protein
VIIAKTSTYQQGTTMPARRRGVWFQAGLAGLAACLLAGIVQSGVAKIQDASDRAH